MCFLEMAGSVQELELISQLSRSTFIFKKEGFEQNGPRPTWKAKYMSIAGGGDDKKEECCTDWN